MRVRGMCVCVCLLCERACVSVVCACVLCACMYDRMSALHP